MGRAAVAVISAITVTAALITADFGVPPTDAAGHDGAPTPDALSTSSTPDPPTRSRLTDGAGREPDATPVETATKRGPARRVNASIPAPVAQPTGADPKPTRSAPPAVPESGSGRFAIVPRAQGRATGRAADPSATTYRIEVEAGLPVSSTTFARSVRATLSDPRSWAAGQRLRLSEATSSSDFRIVLASPHTTDLLCAPLQTRGRVSCRNGDDVVINAWRWVYGADAYAGDLRSYRDYVVNHEVGHRLGQPHASCPTAGALAPVMVQQTLGLDGCRANPWPFPARTS